MRTSKASSTKYYDVEVPGGWEVRIPTPLFKRDDPRLLELVLFYQRLGAAPAKAEELAVTSCVELFEGSWQTKLKMVVGRAAKKYVKMHGDLEGFDPARVQKHFVPGGEIWRGRRNLAMEKELLLMREEFESED